MTMKRLLFAITLLIFCLRNIIVATHVYSDSFPTNDEYDFNVLDPHHIYGSPYGGFGRATRSRLAALPLHLPGTVGEFHTGEGEFYMEMRDGDGRLFACRTYHEDELTQDSLAESMFTTAQLTGISEISEDIEDQDVSDTTDVDVVAEEETVEKEEEQDAESIDEAIDLHQVLSKLNGVCTQIHKGWWSYEWCHGSKVTQFHVHVESGKQIQLQDITSLGSFSKSTIYEDGDPDAQPELNDAVAEKVKQFTGETEDDPKEVAVVVYDFENGDKCPETNRPRTTKVKLKCCPLKRMNRLKRAVLFHGDQVASNIAAITKMQETSVCNYYLEVCTPLLCEGVADLFQDGLIAKETVAGSEGNIVPTPMTTREKKGTGSIREILGGTLNNVCLRFFNGGWWVYEVCHGRHVRQFHETDKFDPKSGSYSRVPESIHMLGTYDKEALEGFPDEDEPNYVTAPSDETKQNIGVRRNSGIKHDVGAYYVQEYTHGDVCDHRDVTGAAIKAGNVGEGGIERATTVRYFCGEKFEMRRVNEDSTCHYVVDISVPDLCEHKLFKAPVAKKQVIKCLPVDESQET